MDFGFIPKNTIFATYWKNNVEAFRYYLALKSGQFQPNKVMRK